MINPEKVVNAFRYARYDRPPHLSVQPRLEMAIRVVIEAVNKELAENVYGDMLDRIGRLEAHTRRGGQHTNTLVKDD